MNEFKQKTLTRRHALAMLSAAGAGVLTSFVPQFALAQDKKANQGLLRIGYQKAASTLVLLKAHGTLEKRLAPLGIEVKWAEFSAGPQLLEALNVGSVDFGYVGEAPPIIAQAAGADFVYSGYEIPTPLAESILVQQHSPIKTVTELKGKKIAFNKGSDVHWLVISLLKKAGITYSEFQPIYLAPADARAAFERGAVDAWAIWDPFQTAAIKQLNARGLASGAGVVSHHQFFLSARKYAEKNPAIISAILEEAGKEGQWIRANLKDAAVQLAPIQGLDKDVIEIGLKNYAHIYKPIDSKVLDEQQKIADTFFELKLIPKKISTRDAMLATPSPKG
ncbi:sulfonate ABC transporter substrate-binding protein [Glaciimonas sp. CA11.2]|uniref:sulfonate ABC transporter substrate-binding protein n=1 Tax=Glaciimonas sp. CA11.2 TaxID=3048601 RepID=UPI002AB3E335|nr:sulfonate ABC transporter substrate-binding protein [Glaciimonas sp. CA11.2]MDY7549035.1 sulfonate ABC transporter substrate-binding protein [Glaciimonas sp. CA11.2]